MTSPRRTTFTAADGVSLKEHLESRLGELGRYTESRLCSIEKATEVAKVAMERRLEGMNEFRDTLKDQAARFVTQQEFDARLDPLLARISALERSESRAEGKASQGAVNVAMALSLLGLLLSAVALLVRLLGG